MQTGKKFGWMCDQACNVMVDWLVGIMLDLTNHTLVENEKATIVDCLILVMLLVVCFMIFIIILTVTLLLSFMCCRCIWFISLFLYQRVYVYNICRHCTLSVSCLCLIHYSRCPCASHNCYRIGPTCFLA